MHSIISCVLCVSNKITTTTIYTTRGLPSNEYEDNGVANSEDNSLGITYVTRYNGGIKSEVMGWQPMHQRSNERGFQRPLLKHSKEQQQS